MEYNARKFSWTDLRRAIDKIDVEIKKRNFEPDIIVGISRGGLIPAVMLSHSLRCRKFGVLKITRSRSDHIGEIFEGKGLFEGEILPEDAGKILLVDDIVAYGRTLEISKEVLKKKYPKAEIFTVSIFVNHERLKEVKKEVKAVVDFYVEGTNKKKWIVFPWEVQLKHS